MGAESCREAKRCSLFSFFPLLPLPGLPLLGSRLSVKSLSTARPLGLSGSGSGCDFEPWTQECNATQIWCDSGYYNDYTCWYGNYCLDQVSSWDGCPGVCHMPCNWNLLRTLHSGVQQH